MVCKLTEIGSGKWIHIPKTLVDVFALDEYEYEIDIHNSRDIIFKRVKKIDDKEQTTLKSFSNQKVKGGQKK